MVSIAFVFSFLLLCAGCEKQQEDVKQDVPEENRNTLDGYVERTEENGDRIAGYTEVTEKERFGAEVSFEITGDVEHTKPPEPYCNTNEDGSIDLFLSLNWGTIPYDIEGPIYDHDMFSVQIYRKSEGVQVSGDYEGGGGGETTYIYRFTPSQPGETEIAALLQHYGVGYEGTLYNITVEDDLRCRLNWYGRVVQGENLEVFEEDQE